MKKFTFFTFALLAMMLLCQTAIVEARGHSHRRSTRVQVNIGGGCGYREGMIVRRYAAPVAPVVYAPVAPYAPVYVPAYPAYVEEVYSAPVFNPLSLLGLSLSWNFFR